MHTKRLSIAAMMGLVVFAAVGFAALGRPSRLAAAVMFSGALSMLTVALLGAVVARGPRRAGWIGFALGGWIYLLVQYGPFCETQVGPYTFPTAVLDLLYPIVVPEQPPPPTAMQPGGSAAAMMTMMAGQMAGMGSMGGMGGGSAVPAQAPPTPWQAWTQLAAPWPGTSTSQEFYRIGHSLLAVIVGALGAVVGRWLAQRNAEPA